MSARRGDERRVLVPDVSAIRKPHGERLFSWAGRTMGTTWSVRAVAPAGFDAAGAEARMQAALDEVIAQMSSWAPASALSRFNELDAGLSLAPPAEFQHVLACALGIAHESEGAFDPSIGALVDLWGFGARPPAASRPGDADIAAALAKMGWRKLRLQAGQLRQPGGLRLDFSGIAKGYAVDTLAHALRAASLNSFLVEIGGELYGAGVKPDGQPWWVEIEEPPGSARMPILAALHDLAIAGSGDYRRFGEHDGAAIAHTIDPRTGRPCETGLSSVTVLHADCMRADAYATALMVMGAEAGLAFAEAHGLIARFVAGARRDFAETLTSRFAALLA